MYNSQDFSYLRDFVNYIYNGHGFSILINCTSIRSDFIDDLDYEMCKVTLLFFRFAPRALSRYDTLHFWRVFGNDRQHRYIDCRPPLWFTFYIV